VHRTLAAETTLAVDITEEVRRVDYLNTHGFCENGDVGIRSVGELGNGEQETRVYGTKSRRGAPRHLTNLAGLY
jgi:hypothetical protein